MDEKTCIRCDEDDRRAVTLLCTDGQGEACTVGVDSVDKALTVIVRVGDDVKEFSEPITHCPWCGRKRWVFEWAKPVDREALLALADEMQRELDECASDHEIVGKLRYRIDRIREALGVER